MQLLRIKVAWYGLNDGPREFYTTLDQTLQELGCVCCPLDPCVYVWYEQGQPGGVIGITVDDLCCGGSGAFRCKVLEVLQRKFTFGKVCEGQGRFTGRDLKQLPDGSIVVDQIDYIKTLELTEVPRYRRKEKEFPLSDQERTQLRIKAGELNWIQAVSRPDLAGAVSLLQTSFGEPKVLHLLEANRLLKEAKANPVQLRLQAIKPDRLMFVCSADAAWGNCVDLASHMGYLILAADRASDEDQNAAISPIGWKAHKQRRKAASTLSAEAIATSEGIGALDWFRVLWEWLAAPDFCLRQWEKCVSQRPALVLTDCKSVFDSLQQLWSSSSAKADKRTSIDLSLIRENLARDCSRIRWIDTKVQLADSMTKSSASSAFLRETLARGKCQVVSEGLALERRNTQRRERESPGCEARVCVLPFYLLELLPWLPVISAGGGI